MRLEAESLRHGGQPAQLVQCVDRASLGHLGDRDRPALRPVHAAGFFARDGHAQRRGVHLVVLTHQRQLGTTAVEFRRVALVFVDMRHRRTENGLPRVAQRRQRQRIGGGAGGDQIDRRLRGFEHLADALAHPVHQRVGAIAQRIAGVGGGQRLDHLWVDGAGIVGGKEHQVGSSMIYSSQSSSEISNSGTVRLRTETPAECTVSAVPEISGCQSWSGLPSHNRR